MWSYGLKKNMNSIDFPTKTDDYYDISDLAASIFNILRLKPLTKEEETIFNLSIKLMNMKASGNETNKELLEKLTCEMVAAYSKEILPMNAKIICSNNLIKLNPPREEEVILGFLTHFSSDKQVSKNPRVLAYISGVLKELGQLKYNSILLNVAQEIDSLFEKKSERKLK